MTNLVARDVERGADALRGANHATMRGGLDGPETCTALGNLVDLVGRMPQLLDFVLRCVRRADPAAHYADDGRDVAQVLDRAAAELVEVRGLADALLEHLNTAHNQLGHVGRRLSED